ncbi:MAG TPA: FAD-dependent oxidoreductase [Burkholderiaceae bacterium]|nr:FAD-dependent oxidoreductase [Burkholderiaceae bacterium]
MERIDTDLLVIGSGCGGLSTAVTARKEGLDVIVAEKEPVFGGTTAFSGGVLWIPGNRHGRAHNPGDTREAAKQYLRNECGAGFDEAAVDTFLDAAPAAAEWFERETEVKFVPTLYPDYHPTVPGGVDIGRSILAAPYDIRGLGADMARLRPPLQTITFIGMMFNSSNADLKHFFNATKSLTSFVYVAKRLATHVKELLRYGKGIQVTSGNALAARLAKSALAAGVPIWTEAPAVKLIQQAGQVVGAVIRRDGQEVEVRTRRGVVLACGGFPHDAKRIARAYPHLRSGGEHLSPVPTGNTGDGIALAEGVGGQFDLRFPSASAWMPVSRVENRDGSVGVFPHLLDRYKPGVIGVLRNGQRFCNESESYHDVGAAMVEACRGQPETAAWLVCDARALAKYGLGYVKPAPVPHGRFLRNGYLKKGATLAELAAACGIDAAGLERTVREFNVHAAKGEDPAFGRGRTSFNRYLADPANQPNPCVAPLAQGPYYAVKLLMGDLGTFDGLRTTPVGEVLTGANAPIPGLYAVGNDRASLMGGNYPGAGITLGPNLVFGWLLGRHVAGVGQAGNQVGSATQEQRHAA